jgi:calcium-translocating P-type ATPase
MVRHTYPGLTTEQVLDSRKKHGTNDLPEPEVETFFEKLWDNFNDPLIKILLVALVITVVLSILGYSDWLESVGIGSAVFLATFVATWSEHKNEASFQALQSEAGRTHSNVFRNNHLKKVFTSELVVGDYALLQPGEIVPADGVLISGHIMLNEAALTGETEPRMFLPIQEQDQAYDMADSHCIRRSCVVTDGEGVLLVNSVGINTEYGRVAAELSQQDARESPLQVKLSTLADQISKVGYFGASAIAFSFLFKQFVIDNGWSWTNMMTAFTDGGTVINELVKAVILGIIVIVVAVPEGLPTMIAIVLSLNMNRLLKDKVLVRKLLGIETAGSISMLFADKTGTMTKGRFDPVLFLSGSLHSYATFTNIPAALAKVLETSLCVATECTFDEASGDFIGGNPSDQAALAFLPKAALTAGTPNEGKLSASLQIARMDPVKAVMFNSTRKYSATSLILSEPLTRSTALACSREGHITFVKGAPELLLSRCSHYYGDSGQLVRLDDYELLVSEINLASSRGIRVIVIATAPTVLESEFDAVEPPSPLHLVGVLGIRDEVRPSTKGALHTAKEAGIHTVMITGDKRETAVAVAHEVGLLDDLGPNEALEMRGVVMTSEDLRLLKDAEISRLLPKLRVVARALPTDKSRLVQIAQNRGEVVGMTGDGLNDAVALRMADVGFAMGSGVDVAKEAADIIVLDDNFASTMKAVLYGRTIFKSIRKFIVFQSTINLASMTIVFMGPILGFDFPLTLIQLLWVNLVMDTLAALAFGGETPLPRYMTEKPIQREAPIISPYMWSAILVNGLYMAMLSIFFLINDSIAEIFTRGAEYLDDTPNHAVFLTAFFCFFIYIATFNAFNARTTTTNLLDHITDNKNFVFVVSLIFVLQWLFTYFGGSVLRTVPLTSSEWLVIVLLAVTIIPVDLLRKRVIVPYLERRARQSRDGDNLV